MGILIPKGEFVLTDGQLSLYQSETFRHFYEVALNKQQMSLATDFGALYFLGKEK